MSKRVNQQPYVIFTDSDGERATRTPTIAEILDVIMPIIEKSTE